MLDAAQMDAACSDAQRQLADWNTRGPFLAFWFRTTASQLAVGDQVRVVMAYDDAAGLLSFDAWVQDRRVYGADDFLG